VRPQFSGGSLDVLGRDAMHFRVQLLQDREATITVMREAMNS
jgi:hypothetical protein